MLHPSLVKQMSNNETQTQFENVNTNHKRWFCCDKSLVASSFELVSFWPQSFSMWSCTFHTIPLTINIAPHGWAYSRGQYSRGPLWSGSQKAIQNTDQAFPKPVCLEGVCSPSTWLTCSVVMHRLPSTIYLHWLISLSPAKNVSQSL